MELESALVFTNISSLANLNSRTKFESTFKSLNNKLLGKEFQKKLYFNNVVSMKPTLLAN